MTQPPRIERQQSLAPAGLGRVQLAWLAAAVFVVSAGYGALMPLLPAWLGPLMAADGQAEVARHVGLLSGLYAGGVLVGAPLWGLVSDRWGRGRILVIGLVGYVTSLLPLLWADWVGLAGIYALRGATGFFVAAVVPVVPALVAEHTPQGQRARRFAWLGAMSLLGFLFGPGLNAAAAQVSATLRGVGAGTLDPTDLVILMSAALGALMMLGLAATLPRAAPAALEDDSWPASDDRRRALALWGLNGVVMFVLSGFELGIVLQGQQHPTLSSREISLMFAECSLVMLGVNALLFFTGLLERAAGRGVMAAGLVLAIAGLAMLAQHRSDGWMYIGVSLTAAGTGLVLPTISYLAAGASRRRRLGATMGGLAAAAGFGQTLGSAAAGWLFGAVAQFSFAWLALPLLATLGTLIVRPAWWSTESQPPHSPRVSPAPLPK